MKKIRDRKTIYKPKNCLFLPPSVDLKEAEVARECEGVYTVPLVLPDLCRRLAEEVDHFRQSRLLPHQRPNSMNRGGVLLAELGLQARKMFFLW